MNIVRCFLEYLHNRRLYTIHNFDTWHIKSGYYCRAYKPLLVSWLNEHGPYTLAVEIGCGLGDVLSRLQADRMIGIDIDEGAIQAARKKYPNPDFLASDGNHLPYIPPKAGIVIMVNWLHNLTEERLHSLLCGLAEKQADSIVVDQLDPSVSGYPRYHRFEELIPKAYTLHDRLSLPELKNREFLLFSRS
ncbi:MAG: methyltransferase domain-containing protein [Spirochaetales bacterium]|nr:methyltransferase domain-containing protein [Spirochaetales bacterium]MCF7937744.1 methyltransferase domain-containing protein [Spirochaetales bacterium]